MITLIDQIGISLTFQDAPKRIVSLVPSQTELLVDLGLINAIKGVTKFCVHPKELRKQKKVVGGTKQVNIDKIKSLNPDIILCNKEENTQEMVEQLRELAPVHVSDVKTIEDTQDLIRQYGKLFDADSSAKELAIKIENLSKEFRSTLNNTISRSCIYLIWRNPYMAAGQGTFINHLLELNGLKNVVKADRYPEIPIESMAEVDFVLLSSEPYPFAQKHIQEIRSHTKAQVVLVDGEYFSWYGSRLLGAFNYFKKLKLQLEF